MTELAGIELFEEISLHLGVGGLVMYMLFVMYRLAVESGIFPLFEGGHGKITGSTKIRRQQPVAEYLRPQRRFAHVFKQGNEHQLAELQALADRNIERFDLLPAGGQQS